MKEDSISYYKEAINLSVSYIEQNLSNPIYLEDISQAAHLSKFHFHRIFKAFTKETINSYLTRLRVEKAALLISKTNCKLSDIAVLCGFNTPEHFSRSFKNHFECSPTEYREWTHESRKLHAENSKSKNMNNVILSAPEIKTIAPIKVAYIRALGAYDLVGSVWNRLISFGFRNFLVGFKVKTMGIVHDSPEITEEANIRYDACIAVRKEIVPRGDIGYKVISGGRYVVYKYKGAYRQLGTVYDYIYTTCLFELALQMDDRPAFEIYLNSPRKVQEDLLLTEIYSN